MKKLVLFLFVLITAAACAPPTNQTVNTNTASPSPTVATLTEAEAIAKERALWDTLKAKDLVAFEQLLSADYIEVLPDGANDRATTLADIKDLEISDVTFADWQMIPLGNDAALLLYTATIKGKYKGEAFPEGPYRNASGWVNRGGKWLAFYYQETLSKPAPTASASPVASPTLAASPAASPAASVSVATLPADPIEREKMIWDMLKRKDYDAFASYLDPAQVEVGPEGVSDRAKTLQGVRTFDASTAQLSDFKTIKVNATTDLVTYLVTFPGPVDDHLATTIWVNRGGKWQAVFHQGTTLIAVGSRPSPGASPSPSPSPSASAPATPAK